MSEAPAARRLTPKGQATRDRIVSAAATLMYERGVAATSNEDVQQAASVGASQLYHYFADKKSLVRAVIAHQAESVIDAQLPALGRLDSLDALEAYRDVVLTVHRTRRGRHGCPLGSLSSELSSRQQDTRQDLLAGFARWEQAIRDGLVAMRERGELSADADPERLALGVLAAVQGGLLLTQVRHDSDALEAALDLAIDGVRRYASTVSP